MKIRKSLIVGTWMTMLVSVGLAILLIVWQIWPYLTTPFTAPWRIWPTSGRVKSEVYNERSLPIAAAHALIVRSDTGDVSVHGADVSAISYSFRNVAWGSSAENAAARLDRVQLDVSQSGPTVEFNIKAINDMGFMVIGRSPYTMLVITVPHQMAVNVIGRLGDVALSDTIGTATLLADAGQVTARHVEGKVSLTASLGNVIADNVRGELIEATTSSGSVRASDIHSLGLLSLRTNLGEVVLNRGTANSLVMQADSGRVDVSNSTVDQTAKISCNLGELQINNVAAQRYELSTDSGSIHADGVLGVLEAHASLGEIHITHADVSQLTLSTASGSVFYAGKLGVGPHRASTNLGSVQLQLPSNIALNVDLAASLGSVHSALPVTVVDSEPSSHLRGTVNNGGPSLLMRADTGDVALERLTE